MFAFAIVVIRISSPVNQSVRVLISALPTTAALLSTAEASSARTLLFTHYVSAWLETQEREPPGERLSRHWMRAFNEITHVRATRSETFSIKLHSYL